MCVTKGSPAQAVAKERIMSTSVTHRYNVAKKQHFDKSSNRPSTFKGDMPRYSSAVGIKRTLIQSVLLNGSRLFT